MPLLNTGIVDTSQTGLSSISLPTNRLAPISIQSNSVHDDSVQHGGLQHDTTKYNNSKHHHHLPMNTHPIAIRPNASDSGARTEEWLEQQHNWKKGAGGELPSLTQKLLQLFLYSSAISLS